jgi:hypothetical protein
MNDPFRPLHLTRKKCKCGFVGTRTEFLSHMSTQEHQLVDRTGKMSIQAFFERHGEVPCYADDPSVPPKDYTSALEKDAKRQAIVDSL